MMMNCEWVEDRYSAYIDCELDVQEIRQFEEHCTSCIACRTKVLQFQAIGTLMRQSEPLVDTDAIWERAAMKLDRSAVVPLSTKSLINNWGFALLATAASIVLIWILARSNPSLEHGNSTTSHEHNALAVDFQDVIRTAKTGPKVALAKLASKYQGKVLDPAATTDYLGYEPVLFNSVLKGFTRVSTHVLDMPCCKCSASICDRSDGTSLIVFEHKDEQPVWFGDSPSIETQCHGKKCKIIESAGQLAVSWKHRDRQLTLIGANDIAEVNQWVAAMKL